MPYSLALATSIGMLYALEGVPLPVEMTALVMVGLILRWLLRRENKTDSIRDERIAALEAEVGELRASESEQRHLKHVVLNQLTIIRGTFALAKQQAEQCTCDAMTPVIPLLDNILKPLSQPLEAE